MLGLAGVTAIDCNAAAVTVKVVLPEIVPDVAVTFDAPVVTPVARPEALTVATAVLDDVQVTVAVIFCDVPSE